MTTRELRKALFQIENQEITVKELRDLLYEIEEQDTELTEAALMLLTKKSSFEVEFEGETEKHEFAGTMSKSEFFSTVAKSVCFEDCGDYRTKNIIFRGVSYRYKGWQPDMVIGFEADNGDVWEGCFPGWDH